MLPPPPRSTLFPYTTLFRSKKLPEGWAQGIAIDDRRRGVGRGNGRQGTICAQVHTVEVTQRGQLKVHRVDVVFDTDRKSTRLNSSHGYISYAVFCLKKKKSK